MRRAGRVVDERHLQLHAHRRRAAAGRVDGLEAAQLDVEQQVGRHAARRGHHGRETAIRRERTDQQLLQHLRRRLGPAHAGEIVEAAVRLHDRDAVGVE